MTQQILPMQFFKCDCRKSKHERHGKLRLMILVFFALNGFTKEAFSQDTDWNCESDQNGSWLCGINTTEIKEAYMPPNKNGQTEIDPSEPRVAPTNNLDWLEESHMSNVQKERLTENCCGAYIEPTRNYPDSELDPKDAALRFSASKTEAFNENVAILEGDVQISQGYRQVRSDLAVMDQSSRNVSLTGNVQFREPGMLLLGSQAQIDTSSREVTINNTTYLLHDSAVSGTARLLKRREDGLIVVDDATYSTCEPDDNTWQLVTKQIEIDQAEGFATVKSAKLEVNDLPVFYFPRITFPISNKRSSGLLFPTIGVNRQNGFDILQPIYWNIAPHYDATFTPRYISERGAAFGGEFRHLSTWAKTELNGQWLFNDLGGKEVTSKPQNSDYRGQTRYLASFDHRGGFERPWKTYINLNKVSDTDYFNDLGTEFLTERSLTHLQRVTMASFKKGHWNFGIETEDYQVISQDIDEQYAVLPKISVDGYFRPTRNIIVDINQTYTRFEHEDAERVAGQRLNLIYSMTWDKRFPWGYFVPKANLQHIHYSLKTSSLNDKNPSVSVPTFSIDSGLFFERDLTRFGDATQTLEPRIYYVNTSFKDQSSLPDFDTREFTPSYNLLFRDNRFSGGDRIADANRATISLTSRFIDKKTGQEKFKASVAQAIYLSDRNVSLSVSKELDELRKSRSPMALNVSAHLAQNWRIASEVIYDTQKDILKKSNIGFRYRDSNRRLFNITYRFTRRPKQVGSNVFSQDIKQGDISGFWPLTSNLNFVWRWNHDFTNSRELEIFSGLEYKSCCWRASLVAHRGIRRDDDVLFPERDLQARNSILFQIQFKGLAGNDGRIDSILQKGIYGYEPMHGF